MLLKHVYAQAMKGERDKHGRESMPGHASIGLEEAFVLASNIEYRRETQNLTKTKLALMANISRPTLDRIEKGHPTVRLEDIVKLADALDTTAIGLLTPSSNAQNNN